MKGQSLPLAGQQRQHTPLASLFLYSFPPQGKAGLASGQRMAKHLLPESGLQPGWEESRHSYSSRSGHPGHTILLQVTSKAQLWLFVPSHLTFSSPQQHFVQTRDTGTPLLPAAYCASSSCSLPYKTGYHPQTHNFSKHSSHFLFASPSPSLSWVLLLFVLAILGWRLFGEGNTV